MERQRNKGENHSENGFVRPIEAIEDIKGQHAGKWLLLRVAEFDARRRPLSGRLIEASSSHARIYKKLAGLTLPSQEVPPGDPYYVVRAPGKPTLLQQFLDNLATLTIREETGNDRGGD